MAISKLTMDGAELCIGDRVYVLLQGSGVVTGVRTNGIITIKTPKGEAPYAADTYSGRSRRVYWHDPITIIPPKHAGFWETFLDMSMLLFDKLLFMCNSGLVVVPDEDSTTDAAE